MTIFMMARLLLFYAHRDDNLQVTNMLMTLFSFWLHVHKCCIRQERNTGKAFNFVASQFAE